MASITQTVPHYNGGISQQPDEKKIPGQVREAKNVLPDITQGLLKRPGGKLVASLSDNDTTSLNSQTNGKWFHYWRDETEQYIGQVSRAGDINMWRCSDGFAMTVTYDSGTSTALTNYLTHTTDQDIQTLTLNDYTYLLNRTKTAAMAGTVKPARPYEAFIELKQIKYASQYGLDIYNNTATTTLTTATRLNVTYSQTDAGGSSSLKTSGTCDSIGTQIFGAAETDTGSKKNLYFRITTNGQPTTEGSSTAPVYKCRYQVKCDLLYGGEGWTAGDNKTVTMTTPIHNSNYTVTVAEDSTSTVKANLALVRPQPTAFDGDTVVTADSILGSIREGITGSATANTGNGFTIEQIGTGLYITRTDGTFNISTPAGELMNVLSDSVQDVAQLPLQCKHGYIVKVANSEADEDDYYMQFYGKDDRDGPGVWEECAKPGRKTDFDKGTLPVQIVRTNATTFTLTQVDWDTCLVGDTTTAPEPSFIGKTINKLLFYRNRLAMLSDENVIISQPGAYYNFWPKSAMTHTPSDVIDLSCSSNLPAVIYDGIEINSGLLLFTKNQQFMLTTDSDILSPLTAKINSISHFNFNYKTNPVSMGTTVGFLDNAGKYTRFWEASGVVREGEPLVMDQTKVVSKLFDKDLIKISNSRENSVVFFSQKDTNKLYGFRYFNAGPKRLMQSWFTWELSGTIQHHAMLDDALYVIVRNSSKDVMQKFSLKLDTDSKMITDDQGTTTGDDATDDDIIYRIHLDNATTIASSSLSAYDAVNKRTTFTLPDGFNNSSGQLAVYVVPSASDTTFQGRSENVSTFTDSGVTKVSLPGNWKTYDPQFIEDGAAGDDVTPANNIILGYQFDMEVKFPTLYVTKTSGETSIADMNASLILHRLKLNMGPTGLFQTVIDRTGKPTYTETWEPTIADAYGANRVQINDTITQTVPVYERNKNLTVTLKSTHPTPATLYSMSWEGDYTTNFYKRV